MNEKYLYRFKTEEEFINEYGKDWRKVIGFNYTGKMDYLCGLIYEVELSKKEYQDRIDNNRWFGLLYHNRGISPKMLKLRTFEPNYKPKKFSKEI